MEILIIVRIPITLITLLNTLERLLKSPRHIAISRVPTVAAPNKANKLKKALKTSTAVVLLTTAVLSVIYRLPLCFESQNPAALAAAAFTLTNGEYKLENSKTEKPTASDQKPTESADTEPISSYTIFSKPSTLCKSFESSFPNIREIFFSHWTCVFPYNK